LKEGDEVLSCDPECGEKSWQRVTQVYERTATELLDITVAGVRISCTPEHPLWVEGAGWIAAKQLKPGTQLLKKDGHTVRVESIRHREGSFTVYNVGVERLHSYYVTGLGILVHNQCQAGGLSIAERIGRGHAFVKHVLEGGEFEDLGIQTGKQFGEFVENIMQKQAVPIDFVDIRVHSWAMNPGPTA